MGPSGSLILVVFFLSGAAGLVYEVLWTRQLALIFGVTTYAVSTVLATFMGGLALVSFLIGRFVDRSRNPILVYALLEIGIALLQLIFRAGEILVGTLQRDCALADFREHVVECVRQVSHLVVGRFGRAQ